MDDHIIAIHEAGHAVISILLGMHVSEIGIDEPPFKDDRRGYCCVNKADSWRNELWCLLAGPVVTAIHEDRSGIETFTSHDMSDFDRAWSICMGLVRPHLPEEFAVFDRGEQDEFICAVAFDGWYPPSIRGQAKRKLEHFPLNHGHTRQQQNSSGIRLG